MPLEAVDHPPEGFPPVDLPPQVAVSTPDCSPEEIEEIARKLRVNAGLGDEPLGEVIPAGGGMIEQGPQDGGQGHAGLRGLPRSRRGPSSPPAARSRAQVPPRRGR